MYINGTLWIVREKKSVHTTYYHHLTAKMWPFYSTKSAKSDVTFKTLHTQMFFWTIVTNEWIGFTSMALLGGKMWNWQTYAAVDHLSSAFWPQRFGMHRPTDGIQKSSSSSFYGHKGVILFVGVIFPVDGETHHHHLGRKWFGGNLKRILRWHPKLIFSNEWSQWKMWQK